MVLASDYPFMDVFWTMIIFFSWVIWIWMVVVILTDVFRRTDIGGGHKALWVVLLIVLPFLGVLVYLIAQHNQMAERSAKQAEAIQAQNEEYIRSVSSSTDAADQIQKGKGLLDSGAISQAEFDTLKANALAASSSRFNTRSGGRGRKVAALRRSGDQPKPAHGFHVAEVVTQADDFAVHGGVEAAEVGDGRGVAEGE